MPTFRDTVSVPSSRVKVSRLVHYRRFGAPCLPHLQGSRSPGLFITDVSGYRIGPIFKGQYLKACSLPTFQGTVSVSYSRVNISMLIYYRRSGAPYLPHLQGSRSPGLFITDVSGHRIGPIFKGQYLKAYSLLTFRDTVCPIFKGQDLQACSLPTFRDNVSVSSSRVKISTKKFLFEHTGP